MSRDDSGSSLPAYAELDIVPKKPFALRLIIKVSDA